MGDRPGNPQGAVSFAQVFALFAETLDERRTQKLERYNRHREVEVRERDRTYRGGRRRRDKDDDEDVEAEEQGKEEAGRSRDPHVAQRAPRMGNLAWARPPPNPQPQRQDIEPPDAG